ncbi:MAG: alpha/beta fold hydrolase [Gaiellaceae bacterium]
MRVRVIGGALLTSVALLGACGGESEDADRAGGIERVSYGSAPEQFGDLYLPDRFGDDSSRLPVVVLVHGGFWRASFMLDLMAPLADDLVGRGYGVWNIEYRRVGQPGGGYPGTFEDVAAAVDRLAALAEERRLDLDRVAIVGHSAGGHLALWVGQRERLPPGAPGSAPTVGVSLAIGQAPVPDLVAAHEQGVGGTAVSDLMGGTPAMRPAEYATASPAALLPVGAAQVLVHGAIDTIVPVSLSSDYVQLAGSEQVSLLSFPGTDHFDVIDPTQESWAAVVDILGERLSGSG